MLTDLHIRLEHFINGCSCDLLKKNGLDLFFPGQVPEYHFIGDYANAPNVAFKGVSVVFE